MRELDERLTKAEGRLDALERPQIETRLDRLEQVVREGFAEQTAMMNVLLKQRADDRALADQRQTIADQRHAEVMAQLEKIHAKPSEQ